MLPLVWADESLASCEQHAQRLSRLLPVSNDLKMNRELHVSPESLNLMNNLKCMMIYCVSPVRRIGKRFGNR
jgi:hypothetical protein